jgi:hypothetical protein
LIFSRPIFLEVFFKGLNYGGMNLEWKKCELQHYLNVFFEKSLDLDFKVGVSIAHFGLV